MDPRWDSKTCLSQDWGESEQNFSESVTTERHVHCPPIWDGFTCWGSTLAGSTASSQCPSFKGSDTAKTSLRLCSLIGEWLGKDGVPGPVGWTNYTSCLTPEVREIIKRLGSNNDAQIKLSIAKNTRILEFVGLTISLGALLISLFIFWYFRSLRNSRTRLHCHLFVAMVIQVGIRLILYTDQAFTRSYEPNTNTNMSNFSAGESSGESSLKRRRGIDNTASYICLEYARTVMFMWTFVEGLFLHNMITVTVFERNISPRMRFLIGWVLPIPLTVAWATVTYIYYGTTTCVDLF